MHGDTQRYRIAALPLVLSAALHLAGALLSGFVAEGLVLLPVVALYGVLAALLWRGYRSVAWIVFLCMLIGAVGAWIASGGVNLVPTWIYYAIALADVACAAMLFVKLW